MLKTQGRFLFGPFVLDLAACRLLKDGEGVNLPRKAFDLLATLVSQHGRMLSKEELLKAVWPDTFVEENNLSVNISTLRKVLGDGYIENVPRRGYRFVAAVEHAVSAEPAAPEPPVTVVAAAPKDNKLPWWMIAASGAAVALLFLAAYLVLRPAPGGGGVESLAVLPFKGAQAGDELGFGLADATISRLGPKAGLRIPPTQAVRHFDVPGQDPLEAGRKLGVETVLDGTLQRNPETGRLRLSVQLIRVQDGKHLWAQTYEQAGSDLFALEDDLARELSEQIGRQLLGKSNAGGALATAARGTSDAESHRLYLLARYHFLRGFHGKDAMAKAGDFASQAISRDPNYPGPYTILAGVNHQLAMIGGVDPREAMLKAKECALRAVELAPDSGEAHATLALVQLYSYDPKASRRSHEKALELDPNNELALIAHSDYHMMLGDFEESLRTRRKLQAMIPLEPLWVADVAHPLLYSGRYEEALQWTRRALEMDPRFPLANTDLSLILRLAGKAGESVAASLTWRETNGGNPELLAELRAAFQHGGLRAYDAKRLEQALRQGVGPMAIASAYADLGDAGHALDYLEKAYLARAPQLINLKAYPGWRPLRGSARYEALLERLGLK